VIGGIGSIRGALAGALLVGVTDTMGRIFLPVLFGFVTDPASATSIGSSLSSMLIYLMMAAILAVKPRGLFPANV
jgi:branched-chain amino acid transport system permease protein